MSCTEKQHVSRKSNMKHPSNLDSFMDEADREVMSLTDRAFKSLCIGDEAIYNDSELLPSPVDCHKPIAEEKTKKHGAHRPNGVYNTAWQINKTTSKMSSLFAAFVAKKNTDTKMTNGDSWDKSALLSIQTELSSDYQNQLTAEHVKSHRKRSEKGTVNKLIQDTNNSSAKSAKNQHSKSTKLRKLNSKNFFLHSEFSPFQSWGDLNRYGLEHMEMFPCNSPAGLNKSPVYSQLNNSNRLHVPEPNQRETSQSTSPLEPQNKSKSDLSQCKTQTLTTVPPVPDKNSEQNFQKQTNIQNETVQTQVLLTSSESFPRCQSDGDLPAPWRKSRSRAKGVAQPLISLTASERSNTGEEGAIPNTTQVRTVEEATCLNLTPFSISQLLTPVIPSRQGTGTSEILQSLHSPGALDIPAIHENEICQSPDIKREGYKSKASSLLFNLKDNRKRVKATYNPPQFKVLDAAEQNKLSPLIENDVTKNIQKSPEIRDAKTTSAVQKTNLNPKSPETADMQSAQSSGHINSALPDDFLGLSLLQDLNRDFIHSKSKTNPLAKVTYPSLNLYRKSSPIDLNTKTMPVDVHGSHPTSAEQKLNKEKGRKEMQRKHQLTKPKINNVNHEYTNQNHDETSNKALNEKNNAVDLKEKYIPAVLKKHTAQKDALTISGSRNKEKIDTGGIFTADERLIKNKESNRKETTPKHLFSARQNNYIKNQRYVNVDEGNNEECEYWQENVIAAGRDEPRKEGLNEDVYKGNGQENRDTPRIKDSATNDAGTKNYQWIPSQKEPGIDTEKGAAKNDASSMKGNTSAKIALFSLREQPLNTVPGSKKKNIIKDKYELATVALEKRIAEREQREKLSGRQSELDVPINQESMLASNQKKGGQEAISDFTSTCQNGRSMSGIDTFHGESHVPVLKLEEPYKQEGAAKHSPSRLIFTARERSDKHGQYGDINSMADVTQLTETVCMPKNISLDQGISVVQDYIDSNLSRMGDDFESSNHTKKGSCKPEAPPGRERTNSPQSEDIGMYESKRKEDVRSFEKSVKNEDCLFNISNLPRDEGPVKGHVSSLIEKIDRKQVRPRLNVQDVSRQEEGLMVYPGNNSLKQKAISPKDMLDFPEVEGNLTKVNYDAREKESDSKELPDKDSKLAIKNELNLDEEMAEKEGFQINNKDVTRNAVDKNNVTGTENESISNSFRTTGDKNKSENYSESPSKEYLAEYFEKFDEPDVEPEQTLNLVTPKSAPVDRVTLYDILYQTEPSLLKDMKQIEQGNMLSKLPEDSSFTQKTESPSLNEGKERKCENLDTTDFCSSSDSKSTSHNLDMAVPLPKDVEKGGWVHCLIESARNLTPTCQSNGSSPILGKPALFKVKDNTFSASPVTKTVRPTLHKTIAGVTQPWSPRESLSGSERGEEDQDLFKDIVDVHNSTLPSTPVRVTQPNQSSIQVLPPPSFQPTTEHEEKGLTDGSTVPEEEKWPLVICSVSEENENYEQSPGDTVEEITFKTVPKDSTEESKAPSERSESVCSGTENQPQGKPPAVPPKSEKALRRAMKLTTMRIQKAEAKSKSERGRSSEKGSSQKRERRHHSSDKLLSDRSYQKELSTDRGSSNQSTGENTSETFPLNPNTGGRHTTQHNKSSSRRKEKETGKKLQQGRHSSLINTDSDPKGCVAVKQNENNLQQKDQFDTQNINADSQRLGRTSEKYQPHKMYRRAQSLDRFASGKHEHMLLDSENPACKTNTETIKKLGPAQTAPLRQNSIENTYGSPANNILPHSFPMTQRKLLQDLDSGQYFVVDMPVQVKTKTFFDPETGRYVQLPVQSLEGSVPRAQSVEVVNAPPLMLYHGFVPVPGLSLP
ncbi:uncharacterized protein Hap1MRO34_016368 [Clarias gariepinus]|uniref:uncharacterized protein LOC128540976 n=1 Tax=Clarias gariepinus TaxID=13013 RepID=UPI00234DC1E6|nr:uncharacterized protein LOC128540976 [Clarias gariepinus]